LDKTYSFLMSRGYRLKPLDEDFLEKYAEFY
jgi:hypothetical protein